MGNLKDFRIPKYQIGIFYYLIFSIGLLHSQKEILQSGYNNEDVLSTTEQVLNGLNFSPNNNSNLNNISTKLEILNLEAIDPYTVRFVVSVPSLYVNLYGRVEVRYTSRQGPALYQWEHQILAPPEDFIATSQLEFELPNLEPNSLYKIEVTLLLRDLNSKPTSGVYLVRTLPEPTSTLPPTRTNYYNLDFVDVFSKIDDPGLNVSESNSTWLRLSWNKLPVKYLKYFDSIRLKYKEIDQMFYDATPLIHRTLTSYTIENLHPNTVYEFGIYYIPFTGYGDELQAGKMVMGRTMPKGVKTKLLDCIHNGVKYLPKERFEIGCEEICFCESDGNINCRKRCPEQNNLPQEKCIWVRDPKDICCQLKFCDVPLTGHEQTESPSSSSSSTLTSMSSNNSNSDEENNDLIQPINGTVLDDSCQYKDNMYKFGEQFHNGCEQLCICTREGIHCAKLECPSTFGLDVLDPHCIQWEPEPATFRAIAPKCCPERKRCVKIGSCEYEGQRFDNWSEIPSNLTGCDRHCFCEAGKVECRPACASVPALPPAHLPCHQKDVRLSPIPDDQCCKHWTCITNALTDFEDKTFVAQQSTNMTIKNELKLDGCDVPSDDLLILIDEKRNSMLVPGTKVPIETIVKYSCPKQTFLNGEFNTNFCDGVSWVNPHPKCIKMCSPIRGHTINALCIKNGIGVDCNRAVEPGTLAKISCGFMYEKPKMRVINEDLYCTSDGDWNYSPFRCEQICGTINTNIPFSVMSTITEVYKVPWQAAIYAKDNTGKYQLICGGTLIESKIIISAAHCFWNSKTGELFDKSNYVIAVGKFYQDFYATNETEQVQYNNISKIDIPLTFRGGDYDFISDIAVLTLTDHIAYNNHIRPACLTWRTNNEKSVPSEKLGIVAGWGVTDSGKLSPDLRSVALFSVDSQTCVQKKITPNDRIANDKFCVETNDGKNVCKGDSGGGFLVSENINGASHYFLWGIVSSGIISRKAESDECNSNFVTTFTNVQWYESIVKTAIVNAYSAV